MLVCSNPITLHKDGETLRVPCGKCRYCLQKKANRMALQLTLEASTPYVLFVTLTYDDAHLPRVKVNPTFAGGYVYAHTDAPLNFAYSCESDKNFNKTINHGKYDPKVKYYPRYVPILCRSHVTNFVKRVRRQLEYYGYGQIRTYYCGEYGYKRHRPHYHALLYCISEEQLIACKQFVHKSWNYGLVDCQRARSSVSGYLGSYLSSSVLCNGQLWQIVYPPFQGHSIRLGFEGVRHIYAKTISNYCQNPQGSLFSSLSQQHFQLHGQSSSLPLWQTYLHSFLPKLPSFSRLGLHLSLRLYQCANRVFALFGGFTKVLNGLHDYNQGFFKSSIPSKLLQFYEDVNAVFSHFSKYNLSDSFTNFEVTKNVQEIQDNWLAKLHSVSKIFCSNLLKFKLSPIKYYYLIKDFYEDLDAHGLRFQLCSQEEFYSPDHQYYYYTNIQPTLPMTTPPNVISQIRSSLDNQFTKSIVKKSHLF